MNSVNVKAVPVVEPLWYTMVAEGPHCFDDTRWLQKGHTVLMILMIFTFGLAQRRWWTRP